jgi:lysozyme
MMADAVALAASLCRPFEGLYLRPYLCPAAVATIGYGSTVYENGTQVTLHDAPITRERAEALLVLDLRVRRLPAVMKLCPTLETPEQVASIMDFVYNLGVGRLQSSTLRKRILQKDWAVVPDELNKWVIGGGRRLNGLVKRRQAEAVLFSTKLGQ